MTDDMHPEVAAVLRQAKRLQSLMDEQLDKMANETFTASDETETVEVTLNGHHLLKDVHIQDGLLRLGAVLRRLPADRTGRQDPGSAVDPSRLKQQPVYIL